MAFIILKNKINKDKNITVYIGVPPAKNVGL
jgi:hypothetical protein